MSRSRTRLPRVAVAATAVASVAAAAAAPAFADTVTGGSVPVTVVKDAGTRQFAVQDLQGNTLSKLDLGHTGQQPFKVVVTDTSNPAASALGNYSVSAVMNNLYLQTGNGHSYTQRIPSSDVSIAYPTTPLQALGVSFPYLPSVSLTGALSCTSINAALTSAGLATLNPLTSPVCTTLTTVGSLLGGVPTVSLSSTVNGLEQTVTPLLTNLLQLPESVSGNQSGPFTQPDYVNGVGANDPGKTATAGTPITLIKGAAATGADLTALLNQIKAVFNGLPLTTVTDSGALAPVSAVLSALQSSTTSAVAQLGNALSTLSTAQLVAIFNTLTATLNLPDLGGLENLTGSYQSFPILKASTANAPIGGTYEGTMTVTAVQS